MSTEPHYTGFPLKIRVVSFLFLKHSSSIAWVRLSAGVSHFYVWIIVPYTWHQTLGCLVTRPACSSGHCHCSGMHSLSTQKQKHVCHTTQQTLSNTSSQNLVVFYFSMPLCCFCLYFYNSKTTAVFSPTPHKLECTQKHLHTALYLIMLADCENCMEFRDLYSSLLRLTPSPSLPALNSGICAW